IFSATFLMSFPNAGRLALVFSLVFSAAALILGIDLTLTGTHLLETIAAIGFAGLFFFIAVISEGVDGLVKHLLYRPPRVVVRTAMLLSGSEKNRDKSA
ncbi:MAG: hypothetical protein PHQ23_12775, partial [Candidatus Wallbacteria bacterium]|nr:hypothetical protein [Candidatus Wallbacteria bacterium]